MYNWGQRSYPTRLFQKLLVHFALDRCHRQEGKVKKRFSSHGALFVVRSFGNLQKGDRAVVIFVSDTFLTRIFGGGTVAARGRSRAFSARRAFAAAVRRGRLGPVS